MFYERLKSSKPGECGTDVVEKDKNKNIQSWSLPDSEKAY